jgi:hypothetical protein
MGGTWSDLQGDPLTVASKFIQCARGGRNVPRFFMGPLVILLE